MHKPLSLRAQAVAWLAQREYSAHELRARLLRRLQVLEKTPARQSTAAPGRVELPGGDSALSAQLPPDNRSQVDEVIDWLLQRGYLNEQRFIASRLHVRSERFGTARIEQELSHHGLALAPEAKQALRSTEFERALAVWQRRFGAAPADLRDAARQARFLAGRGFSADVIRRVVPRIETSGASDRESS